MSETEIGYIDYSTLNVDKNATYESLRDRVVLITGAGQAIGRGYAHYFSAHGAIPIIADINGENAERVKQEIEDKQGRAMAIQVDVADEKSNIEMVDKILAKYGRLDVLINNAAIFSQITMAPFWELPVDEWKRAVDVNVNGAFLCARAAVHPDRCQVGAHHQCFVWHDDDGTPQLSSLYNHKGCNDRDVTVHGARAGAAWNNREYFLAWCDADRG